MFLLYFPKLLVFFLLCFAPKKTGSQVVEARGVHNIPTHPLGEIVEEENQRERAHEAEAGEGVGAHQAEA